MQNKLKFGDPKSIEARDSIERESFLDELIEKSDYELCLVSDVDAAAKKSAKLISRVFGALTLASEDAELEPEYLPDFLEIARLICEGDDIAYGYDNINFLLFEKYLNQV